MNTEIWYGTFERAYEDQWIDEIDGLLEDQEAMKYIKVFWVSMGWKRCHPNYS